MGKKFLISSVVAIVILGVLGAGILLTSSEPKENSVKEVKSVQTSEPVKQFVKIEVFEKGVSVQTPGSSPREAVQGEEIPVGTKIKTDKTGRGQLVYPNKSVTRIDFNSEMTLSSFEESPFKAKVNVGVGRIWSRIAKLLGNESYETQTPNTVATIRGTSYGHEATGNGDEIMTTKGEVDTNCINKEEHELVKKDMKVFYVCKKSSKGTLSKISFSDKDSWYVFNNEKDKELNNLFGGETYSDEDGVLGLTTVATPTPTPRPIALIDCVGIDGKITKQTKENCDLVKKFWDTHPPAPEDPAGPMPQSAPVVVITPTLENRITGCVDLYTCSPISISIYGTNLDNAINVYAVDASGKLTTAKGINVTSSQIDANFDNSVMFIGDYTVKVEFSDGTIITGPTFSVIDSGQLL